ncbi:MAG: hypothetical protein HRU41_38935 [Saprospiraceae bacterium]|nr:hypothetical protein [Saprospiraceae bacterium]
MEEKIMTLHPTGKKGVNILKRRYDQMAETLLGIVRQHGEITYSDMNDIAEKELDGKFDGKIPWYVVTVKLDLEARGILERIPKTSPHKLRIAK